MRAANILLLFVAAIGADAFGPPRKAVWQPQRKRLAPDAMIEVVGASANRQSRHPYLTGVTVPRVGQVCVTTTLSNPMPFADVVCMLDGGLHLHNASCKEADRHRTETICRCTWESGRVGNGYHAVALFGIASAPHHQSPYRTHAEAISNETVIVFLDEPAKARQPWKSSLRVGAVAEPHVGVYFTTISDAGQRYWLNFSEVQGVRAAPTVEEALRDGTPFQDLINDADLAPAALFPINNTDWPQAVPAVPDPSVAPFYCFYRPRPGEAPILPSCPNISYHASRQAALLTMAGVDFVLQDGSNFGPWDPSLPYGGDPVGDFRQMRPFQVLAEEWLSLRQGGQSTPGLGVFNRIGSTTNDSMWKVYLSGFYGNATYDDLVARVPQGGAGGSMKKLFALVNRDDLNTTAEAIIQSDGGRDDVLTPRQWLSQDVNGSDTDRGLWTYMQPCLAHREGTNTTVFTSTVWPAGPRCGHSMTRNSSAGSVWTVSMAQVFGSMPFANPGKLRGAFFKMQMADVLASGGAGDILYSPSWNENSITPVYMNQWDMTNPYFLTAGTSKGDDYRNVIWMDGFGADRSRVIEPMVEDGGLYFGVYASCVRVLRLSRALGADMSDPQLPCSVAGEECCQYSAEELVHPVWSVENPSTGDRTLVATQEELQAFKTRGYSEVCNPYGLASVNGGPTAFCTDGAQPWCNTTLNGTDVCFRAVRGPTMLQSGPGPAFTQPLYRCAKADGFHAISGSAGCGSAGGNATLLGYAWTRGGSAAPRRLRTCQGEPLVGRAGVSSGASYHTLDHECLDGSQGAALGWVL